MTLWRDYISLEQQGGKLLEQVAGVREVLDCCWMDGRMAVHISS